MKNPFRIYLKAGERLFVNGAVLRVDRKVSIEFLNDVAFLLESHVMQPEEATSPLRHLYFVVQAILIDKGKATEAWEMYHVLNRNFLKTFDDQEIRDGLNAAQDLATSGKLYDALRTLKALFPIEDRLPGKKIAQSQSKEVAA